MNSEIVRESLKKFSDVLSFNYPAIGWFFSEESIEKSYVFKKDQWVCMFAYIRLVFKGKRIQFSADIGKACTGPTEFFGFAELEDDDGIFLAEVERFIKTRELSQAYTEWSKTVINPPKAKYLYMEKLENIDFERDIEVVNLFPSNPTCLANLVTLSGYDRESNIDNVLAPNCSGCQSIFTLPFNENQKDHPNCILGLNEPMVRNFVPKDMLLFSIPANRFVEMANNIEGSFLDLNFKNPTGF